MRRSIILLMGTILSFKSFAQQPQDLDSKSQTLCSISDPKGCGCPESAPFAAPVVIRQMQNRGDEWPIPIAHCCPLITDNVAPTIGFYAGEQPQVFASTAGLPRELAALLRQISNISEKPLTVAQAKGYLNSALASNGDIWMSRECFALDGAPARLGAAIVRHGLAKLAHWEQRYDEYLVRFGETTQAARNGEYVEQLYPYEYECGRDYWRLSVYARFAKKSDSPVVKLTTIVPVKIALLRRQFGRIEVTRGFGDFGHLRSYTLKLPLSEPESPSQPSTLVISLISSETHDPLDDDPTKNCAELENDVTRDLRFLIDAR